MLSLQCFVCSACEDLQCEECSQGAKVRKLLHFWFLELMIRGNCSNVIDRNKFLHLNAERERMQNEKQFSDEWCSQARLRGKEKKVVSSSTRKQHKHILLSKLRRNRSIWGILESEKYPPSALTSRGHSLLFALPMEGSGPPCAECLKGRIGSLHGEEQRNGFNRASSRTLCKYFHDFSSTCCHMTRSPTKRRNPKVHLSSVGVAFILVRNQCRKSSGNKLWVNRFYLCLEHTHQPLSLNYCGLTPFQQCGHMLPSCSS